LRGETDDGIAGKGPAKAVDVKSCRFQFTFWAEEPDRFRVDVVPLPSPKPTLKPLLGKSRSVANATQLSRLEESTHATDSPICSIWTFRGGSALSALANAWPQNGWALHALATINPPDALITGRRPWPFRVLAENALVDGLRCIELEHANGGGTLVEKYWVDPARDDVIVAYELRYGRQENAWARMAISIQYRRDRVQGWIPASWTVKQGREISENTVTKFTIDEKFPAETFALKTPPGTVVFDQKNLEKYRVANDGSKSDVVKFDSQPIFNIQKALETRADFQIEPQSLRDAIDFIAARYQIPILLMQREFDAARIDTTSEVQSTRGGVTVAELLRNLLSQMSRPVGFRIEDEVLKISPKFAGQAPPQAKAAPVPPKLETPTARKIQNALDRPVDFTIEPQFLRDALDYIAARYQIPIALNPAIDARIEVKASCPGIKLRSLLSILLEQPRKPLGFKIEDDFLKIFPKAEVPKRPVSSSDVSKMNQAIQKALETKTNAMFGPASFRAAIDDISKRFKIPVTIDEEALEKAKIDPTTEVKIDFGGRDRQGMKLGDGLQLLLDVFRPPLRYEVRDGVLVITTKSDPAKPADPPKK
jgi:hypothetical protein